MNKIHNFGLFAVSDIIKLLEWLEQLKKLDWVRILELS